jgi:Tfp pilus assembly protein PilE
MLYTILVTVIVGIATFAGLSTYKSINENSKIDNIKIEITKSASVARTYYTKSDFLGGGGGSFRNITLSDIDLDSATLLCTYTLSNLTNDSFTVTASPSWDGAEDIVAQINKEGITFEN